MGVAFHSHHTCNFLLTCGSLKYCYVLMKYLPILSADFCYKLQYIYIHTQKEWQPMVVIISGLG